MTFEPYGDGLGIMREAQTAKPESFVTGDGWFVYRLAVNLAEVWLLPCSTHLWA